MEADTPTLSQPLSLDACRGALPKRAPSRRGGASAATVYATRPIPVMPRLGWPQWCADRQNAGSRVEAGAPICTVLAKASSAGRARGLVEDRILTPLGVSYEDSAG